MASLWAVLILTVITFTHSQNSSDTHAIQLPTDVNNNRHTCSPNPCQPGSFCLDCAIYNCSKQTTKTHLCLCQLGEIWKNCDEPVMETTKPSENSAEKVPKNICAFVNPCNYGKCEPTSVHPGYKCQCDKEYTGTHCSQFNALGWLYYWLTIIGGWLIGVLVFAVICGCGSFCVAMWKGPEITTVNGVEMESVPRCKWAERLQTRVQKFRNRSAPLPTTPANLAVECETETNSDPSAVATPKTSEPSVSGKAKTGESLV